MTPAQTITCKYSCSMCGLYRVTVDVPARQAAQGVVEWMEGVAILAVAQDHRARSPQCGARELSELMIPIAGTDRVGGAAVN